MVVIISTHDFASKVRSSIELISKEVSIKHIASDYNEGLKIINEKNPEIDAIIIDASLDGNILNLLHNYKEENMLSKTIVIDNIKLGCYNLIESKYQLYNVIPHNFRIEDLLMYIKDIKEKWRICRYSRHNK